MALTKYHNLLNPDYFINSKYIREFSNKSNINFKLKKNTLQLEMMFETLNVLLRINNNWSNYSSNSKKSFDENLNILNYYLEKYHNKINKCKDKFCIELETIYEDWQSEMIDIKERDLNTKCANIKNEIMNIVDRLDKVQFDYIWNGYFYYKRNPSNKSKRSYCSILSFNNNRDLFIDELNNSTEDYFIINDNNDDDVMYLLKLFKLFGKMSEYIIEENYIKCLKEIIDFSFVNKMPNNFPKEFENKVYLLQGIAINIIDKEYEEAYNLVLSFIKKYEKWFIRTC